MIEVVIAIAIIAILIALLNMAVQRARDAAARTQCSNNLKQIGLALTEYHNINGAFPPGISQLANPDYYEMGWQARILPFLEQEALWQRTEAAFQQTTDVFLNPPHVGLSTVVRVYGCPSDARTSQAVFLTLRPRRDQGRHPTRASGGVVALTSYLGVLGTQTFLNDGVLFTDSHIRIFDIRDGTSNTLMVGERPPSADMRYGWWYAGFGLYTTGTGSVILGVRESNAYYAGFYNCPYGPYHFAPGQFSNECDLFHYWSPHFTGSHFLFADGSVHFLGYDSDNILPALATRAGGEAVVSLP